jgi:hypothetical protein
LQARKGSKNGEVEERIGPASMPSGRVHVQWAVGVIIANYFFLLLIFFYFFPAQFGFARQNRNWRESFAFVG